MTEINHMGRGFGGSYTIDTELIKMEMGYRWKVIVYWHTTMMSYRGEGLRRVVVDGQPRSGFAIEDGAIAWANDMSALAIEKAYAKASNYNRGGLGGASYSMEPMNFTKNRKWEAYMMTCSQPLRNPELQRHYDDWLSKQMRSPMETFLNGPVLSKAQMDRCFHD